MSKDPKPSGSEPSEIVPKLTKTQQETDDQDFWDLEEDIKNSEIPASPPLPTKKADESKVHTKQPVKRQLEIPQIIESQDLPDSDETNTESPKKNATAKKKRATKKKSAKKAAKKTTKKSAKKAVKKSAKKAAKKTTKKTATVAEEKHDLGDIHDLDDITDPVDEDPKLENAKLENPEYKSFKNKTTPETEEKNPKDRTDDKKTDLKDKPTVEDSDKPEPLSPGSFSKIEKISIISLVATLLIAGILCIIHFSNRVPTKSNFAQKIDFPVTGNRVTISAAETYWREPRSGNNADIVRRGTKLIPVLDISIEGKKSSAIRIFFRNNQGEVIGDGITHTISGKTKLKIPATAGFDDVGMHAAYRTGETPSWIVQLFEGPNANASREQFKKVLETEISTVRR